MTGRRLVFVGGAVAVLLIVGLLFVVSRDDSSEEPADQTSVPAGPTRQDVVAVAQQAGVGSPRRPTLPPAEDPEAVVAFLTGEGAGLVSVAEALTPLLEREVPAEADCLAVAEALDQEFAPAELYEVAGDVPDTTTSELFVDLAASTTRFLTACRDGDEVLRGELAYQWVLVDRRLEELGVAP